MKMFSKVDDLLSFWNTTKCDIFDIITLDKSIIIFYKEDERFCKPASNLNIVLSVFTTSYARIELYKLLEKCGESILYCDTDSIITVINNFHPTYFELSSSVGGLKNELPLNTSILKFYALGPKNYAFEYVNKFTGETKVKIVNKGFSPRDVENSGINLDIVKDMAYNICEAHAENPSVEISSSKFKLYTFESKIYTIEQIRKYQSCFEKRNPRKNSSLKYGLSYPWGYRPKN